MEFATGHRITRLVARLAAAYPDRPTEDGAAVLFDTDRGATGSVVVSQVSPGRKTRLWFSFDGSAASYAFDQELPDSLWIGGRRAPQGRPRGPESPWVPARAFLRLPRR